MPLQDVLLSRPSLAAASALVLTLGWRTLGSIFHHFFLRKMTVLPDLPKIGQPRPPSRRIKGTAIICGGSMAGLWTARICADHFEEVLIVEPEEWLDSEEGVSPIYDSSGVYIESRRTSTRTRVEQYTAAHVFQPLALLALRKLFPDFDKTVQEFNGRIADAVFNVHVFGGQIMKLPRQEYADGATPQCFFMSREAYERMLRGLVRSSSDRIKWKTGAVIGLKTTPGNATRLSGVSVRLPNGAEQDLQASLVVDCTGRSQAGLKWLKRIYQENTGISAEDEGTNANILRLDYNTKQRYQNFRFFVPPDVRPQLPIPGGYEHGGPWLYTFMPKPGREQKYFVVDRLDGHRIEMAFGGWGDPPLPADFSEIKPYFENLGADEPVPSWLLEMTDILLEYKDQAVTERSRFPDLSWIRYDKAPVQSIPSNFVAIGDSVMVVNPTFGQGCTKACIGAITLDSLLRSPGLKEATTIPDKFGSNFFKLHADKISGAWEGTKPTDYQWSTTRPVKGEALSDERFAGEFANTIMQLARTDKSVDSALWHVRCFLAPPTTLMRPSVLWKAALFKVKEALGSAEYLRKITSMN